MNIREFKLKKLELEIKQQTLKLKEKNFILKKYKISSSLLLKIYIYPTIALFLILLFKSKELSEFGFQIILIATMIFFILTIVSLFIFIFNSEKEIMEKINGEKYYKKNKLITLIISIVIGSIIGYTLAKYKLVASFLKTSIEIKKTLTQNDNKALEKTR